MQTLLPSCVGYRQHAVVRSYAGESQTRGRMTTNTVHLWIETVSELLSNVRAQAGLIKYAGNSCVQNNRK